MRYRSPNPGLSFAFNGRHIDPDDEQGWITPPDQASEQAMAAAGLIPENTVGAVRNPDGSWTLRAAGQVIPGTGSNPVTSLSGGTPAQRGVLITQRSGPAAAWTAANPVLELAEVGFESDTGLKKTGTGALWNDTPYDNVQLVKTLDSTRDDAALAASAGKALQDTKLDKSARAAANGVAPLDANGLIPAQYVPGAVPEIIEVATVAALPATGQTGKIYLITTGAEANRQYRWGGTAYLWLNQGASSTDVVAEGSANLYFTQARVRATTLGSYTALGAPADIVAGDTYAQALAKAEAGWKSINSAGYARTTANYTAPTAGAETVMAAITMTGLRNCIVRATTTGPGKIRLPNPAGTGFQDGDTLTFACTHGATVPADILWGDASSPTVIWVGGQPAIPKAVGSRYIITGMWVGSAWLAFAVTDAPQADAGVVTTVADLPNAANYSTGARLRVAALNYAEVIAIAGAWQWKGEQVFAGAAAPAAAPLSQVTMSTTARAPLVSIPVPSLALMKVGDRIKLKVWVDHNGSAGAWSVRAALNPTAAGADLATNGVSTKALVAAQDGVPLEIDFVLTAKAGAASKFTTLGWKGLSDDPLSGAPVDLTFDIAVQQYIAVGSGLAGAAGDTLALLAWNAAIEAV